MKKSNYISTKTSDVIEFLENGNCHVFDKKGSPIAMNIKEDFAYSLLKAREKDLEGK